MRMSTNPPIDGSLDPRVAPRAGTSDQSPGVNRAPYPNERLWRRMFRDGHPRLHRYRRTFGWLPSPPRCQVCHVPFAGPGGLLMKLRGCGPSHRNAHYCNRCDRVIRHRPGATDVVLSIVFADVRGSTSMAAQAEHAGDRADYVRRVRRFAEAVKAVFEQTDGFVIDVVGDEVVGVYPPGLCGPRHASLALEAARALTQLGAAAAAADTADGPMLPFGVGVETGEVFLGNRFAESEHPAEDELSKVRIIGDHVNVAARLASAAAAGEALVSDATMAAVTITPFGLEHRSIHLSGRAEPVGVHVLSAGISNQGKQQQP